MIQRISVIPRTGEQTVVVFVYKSTGAHDCHISDLCEWSQNRWSYVDPRQYSSDLSVLLDIVPLDFIAGLVHLEPINTCDNMKGLKNWRRKRIDGTKRVLYNVAGLSVPIPSWSRYKGWETVGNRETPENVLWSIFLILPHDVITCWPYSVSILKTWSHIRRMISYGG